MKNIIKLFCLFTGFLFLNFQKLKAGEYLQVRFNNASVVPTKTNTGTVTDANNVTWTTFKLNTSNTALASLLNSYTIIEFDREYPSTTMDYFPLVYRLRVLTSTSSIYSNLQSLNCADISTIYITNDPEIMTGTNPTDYYTGTHKKDYYEGTAKKYLDLINVKKGWEYTRGDESIIIGIVDVGGFYQHSDLDAKVKNMSNLTVNNTSSSTAGHNIINASNTPVINHHHIHGTQVASLAAAITDNSQGISGVGNKVSLKYYFPTTSAYNEIMQAAIEGCKVINCSWGGTGVGTPNDQHIIDIVTNTFGATVVAAAGNGWATSGTGINTYHYPASFNNVISVSSVGGQYPMGSSIPTAIGPLQEAWSDYYEWIIGQPNGITGVYNGITYYHGGSSFTNNDKVDICAPGYYVVVEENNNGLGIDNGTSLSSPIVAGAAALLYSLNPDFTPTQIEYYLKTGAKNISSIGNNGLYGLGTGRLDVGKSCKLVDDDDVACMPRINNIVWKTGSTVISNNDYYNYTNLNFSVDNSTIPSNSLLEWEFISGNEVVTKTGNNPTIIWGVDFSLYVGPFLRTDKLPLEVYVRQKNTSRVGCYSAFKKEFGTNPNVDGGNNTSLGVYPYYNCDGNFFINNGKILGGDIKSKNVYIGTDFSGNTALTIESTPVYTTNVAADNEIRILPGTHIKRPDGGQDYGSFHALIASNCDIPNWYRIKTPNNTDKVNNQNISISDKKYDVSNFIIYPNPSSNILNYNFFNESSSIVSVSLIDVNGKSVFSSKKYFQKGLQKDKINISNLPKGIYIVKLQSSTKEMKSKIIKE